MIYWLECPTFETSPTTTQPVYPLWLSVCIPWYYRAHCLMVHMNPSSQETPSDRVAFTRYLHSGCRQSPVYEAHMAAATTQQPPASRVYRRPLPLCWPLKGDFPLIKFDFTSWRGRLERAISSVSAGVWTISSGTRGCCLRPPELEQSLWVTHPWTGRVAWMRSTQFLADETNNRRV